MSLKKLRRGPKAPDVCSQTEFSRRFTPTFVHRMICLNQSLRPQSVFTATLRPPSRFEQPPRTRTSRQINNSNTPAMKPPEQIQRAPCQNGKLPRFTSPLRPRARQCYPDVCPQNDLSKPVVAPSVSLQRPQTPFQSEHPPMDLACHFTPTGPAA